MHLPVILMTFRFLCVVVRITFYNFYLAKLKHRRMKIYDQQSKFDEIIWVWHVFLY